jgi:hypothetical protein
LERVAGREKEAAMYTRQQRRDGYFQIGIWLPVVLLGLIWLLMIGTVSAQGQDITLPVVMEEHGKVWFKTYSINDKGKIRQTKQRLLEEFAVEPGRGGLSRKLGEVLLSPKGNYLASYYRHISTGTGSRITVHDLHTGKRIYLSQDEKRDKYSYIKWESEETLLYLEDEIIMVETTPAAKSNWFYRFHLLRYSLKTGEHTILQEQDRKRILTPIEDYVKRRDAAIKFLDSLEATGDALTLVGNTWINTLYNDGRACLSSDGDYLAALLYDKARSPDGSPSRYNITIFENHKVLGTILLPQGADPYPNPIWLRQMAFRQNYFFYILLDPRNPIQTVEVWSLKPFRRVGDIEGGRLAHILETE